MDRIEDKILKKGPKISVFVAVATRVIVTHLTQYTVVTRYASVSVCTHLSEWGEPKNIDVSHDFDDDGDNGDDDNLLFYFSVYLFIFTIPTISLRSKIGAIF